VDTVLAIAVCSTWKGNPYRAEEENNTIWERYAVHWCAN